MFSFINKLTSHLSIRQIVVSAILVISFVISLIIGMIFYSIFTMKENQESISKTLDIEKQNTYILRILGSILETETDILLAKDEKHFEQIESQLFDVGEILNFQRLKNSKYEAQYNPLINELEESLAYEIELQEDFYSTANTLLLYKEELRNYLFSIEREINKIHGVINLISKKVESSLNEDQQKRLNKINQENKNRINSNEMIQKIISEQLNTINQNLVDLEKSTFVLFTLLRDIMMANSLEEVNYIKNNKLEKNYLKLVDTLGMLLVNTKNDKALAGLVSKINTNLAEIDSIKTSFVSLRQNIYKLDGYLEDIIASRTYHISVITDDMNGVNKITNQIVLDALNRSNELIHKTIVTAVIIGVFSFFILVFIAIVLKSRVNNPLATITMMIKDLLHHKVSLSQDIKVEYDDEFKELVDAFNHMTRSIDSSMQELKKRDKEISTLNKELENRVEERTRSLHEKKEKIANLLNNAGEGFLSFGNDFLIDEGYSKECERILGEELSNKRIFDTLFKDIEEKHTFIEQTLLDALSEEDSVVAESFLSLLPKELTINSRNIYVGYKMLADKRYMLILTDITDKKKLEIKVKREQKILKMIVSIVSDPAQFFEIKDEFELFIKNFNEYIHSDRSSLQNMSEIYRVVHTYKGLFSQVFMQNITESLHELESKISFIIQSQVHTNSDLIEVISEHKLYEDLQKDHIIIQEILGDKFFNEKHLLKINERLIIHLEEKIMHYCEIDKGHARNYKDILSDAHRLRDIPLLQLLSNYPSMCKDLALKLEKEIYDFEIIGDETIIVPPEYKSFLKTLIHVFRNAIDHGIEDMESRLEQEKDPIGTIICTFQVKKNRLEISVSDDGQGIVLDKIKEKAIEMNFKTPDELENLSNEAIMEFIFYDEFSTKEEVSDLSGRGIGMASVKSEIEKVDGKIKIQSVEGSGTTFVFILPYKQ